MKRRHLLPCDSCGCVHCECDPNNAHSPGEKEDCFDNSNYDPWSPVDADEPTIEELLATMAAA
jgi:hypothetical protein